MKKSKISESIGNINQKYIEEAATYTHKPASIHKNVWLKIAAVAACLAVTFIGISFLLPRPKNVVPEPHYTNPLNRPYTNYSTSELGVVWPWEYKTPLEKYTSMTFEGNTFRTCGQIIDTSLLGESIGSCVATGYDLYTDKEYTAEFQVYNITGISTDKLVAVDIEGEFCVFAPDSYTPPATLGDLIDAYNLTHTLELSYFTSYDGHEAKDYFSINGDDYIWTILSNCKDATFIEDDTWNRGSRKYISFTVTSETLGVYKNVLYITADGYLWTNMFQWAYIYYIGKDAASQIISYATENATKDHYEPYYYTIAGTIVDINNDYILVDDSILCPNPDDGMVFKVPANNLLIKRYIEHLGVKTGDVIQIEFTGDIDIDNDNIIQGVVGMSEAILSNSGIVVPE